MILWSLKMVITRAWRSAAAVFIVFTLLLGGCSNEPHEKSDNGREDEPVQIEIMTVEVVKVADQVEIVATVQAAKNAVISSRISGNINDIFVSPGSRVEKGQKLLQLSADEISAQLQQARAQLNQATRNLKREQTLLAQNAATPEAVKSLQDTLRIAQANYKEVETMLSYTTVAAPFNGIITRKLVDVGDLATPGKPLVHIEVENNLQVLADVPETLANNLSLGMTMGISIPAAQIQLQGTVEEIAPIADPRTRTVPIKLDIDEKPALRSGQFARVTLPATTVEAILIPPEGISAFGQMNRVYIALDGRARLRLVRTGKLYDGGVEVLSGLSPGDSLIVHNDGNLKDNQNVKSQ